MKNYTVKKSKKWQVFENKTEQVIKEFSRKDDACASTALHINNLQKVSAPQLARHRV